MVKFAKESYRDRFSDVLAIVPSLLFKCLGFLQIELFSAELSSSRGLLLAGRGEVLRKETQFPDRVPLA